MKILITGSSGYLARNCIQELSKSNVEITLYSTSKKAIGAYPCHNSLDSLKNLNFDFVLHAGWGGVTAEDRNSENIQFNNFLFTKKLLESINLTTLKGFIFFGSQSEYGKIKSRINEKVKPQPISNYGLYKKLSGEYLHYNANKYSFKYYHLRIFSIYGSEQGKTWLVPSLIENILNEKKIKLTHPKKKISLLHINDFTKIISEIILRSIPSGIYNICHSDYITLESLVGKISSKLNLNNPNIITENETSETDLIGDNSKILNQLETKNLLTLDQGLNLLLNNEGI